MSCKSFSLISYTRTFNVVLLIFCLLQVVFRNLQHAIPLKRDGLHATRLYTQKRLRKLGNMIVLLVTSMTSVTQGQTVSTIWIHKLLDEGNRVTKEDKMMEAGPTRVAVLCKKLRKGWQWKLLQLIAQLRQSLLMTPALWNPWGTTKILNGHLGRGACFISANKIRKVS